MMIWQLSMYIVLLNSEISNNSKSKTPSSINILTLKSSIKCIFRVTFAQTNTSFLFSFSKKIETMTYLSLEYSIVSRSRIDISVVMIFIETQSLI